MLIFKIVLRAAFLNLAWMSVLASLRASQPEYSHERELPPLQMSVDDLEEILHETHSLIIKANGPLKEGSFVYETIKVQNSGDEITLPGASLVGDAIPKSVYAFTYSYNQSDEPITSVEISLGDYYRRLSIKGEDFEQVEAITSLLEHHFQSHAVIFGGAGFRSGGSSMLFFLLEIPLVFSIAHIFATKQIKMAGVLICTLLLYVLLFTLPFNTLLPGFALYSGDASFLSRYGPEISFAGLLVTTAGIPLSYYLPIWLKKR